MGKTTAIDWPASTTAGLDRRTRRTREALLRALLQLLQEKPLSSITVTELTGLADVNRATFYTHYQDIFDMFDHLKEDLSQTFRAMMDSHGSEIAQGSYDGLIAEIYRFFIENKALFDIVFSSSADSSFSTSLIEVMREASIKNVQVPDAVFQQLVIEGVPTKRAKRICETICHYQFDYIAGGVVSVMRCWMRNGKAESAEQMTLITSSCIKSLNPNGKYPYSVAAARELLKEA